VAFGDGNLRCELSNLRECLSAGNGRPRVLLDGREADEQAEWTETCWFSDRDVDYLELETELGDDWRLQRQFLLARRERFLFVADVILGESSARIEAECVWPLAPGLQWAPLEETREGTLWSGENARAAVIPMSLPEWRRAPAEGRMVVDSGRLRLSVACRASTLYLPLFLDLDPRRMLRPQRTWRQLTVAEKLRIVRSDEAVAYRVQMGKRQWLFYRSLAPAANRTVLGQNLACDFFAARFLRNGQVEPLIELETEEG